MSSTTRPNPPLLGALEAVQLFRGLEAEELHRLANNCHSKLYPAGSTIIEHAAPPDGLFIIATGRLKVVRPRQGGRDQTLVILGPAEVFGEVALFDQTAGRTTRVVALEESVVLKLPRTPFLALLEDSPVISARFLPLLAHRLRETVALLEDVTSLPAGARLAKKLLLLARRFGENGPDGVGLELPLSQQDLGELVDTTRQTINLHLREWTHQGILLTENTRILILDLERLQAIASQRRP